MVWILVGVRGCVAVDAGHGLVTLLSLSVSVKDRSLLWTLGKSQIYCPKRILGYGHREDLLLSCRGFGSFQTDWLEAEMVEVLAPHWVRDSGVGAWSPSLEGTWTPRIGEWWVGPACAWGTSGACVFRVPSWGHWFMNRRTIRYSLFLGLAP